jgi:hypothetical protein
MKVVEKYTVETIEQNGENYERSEKGCWKIHIGESMEEVPTCSKEKLESEYQRTVTIPQQPVETERLTRALRHVANNTNDPWAMLYIIKRLQDLGYDNKLSEPISQENNNQMGKIINDGKTESR